MIGCGVARYDMVQYVPTCHDMVLWQSRVKKSKVEWSGVESSRVVALMIVAVISC